MRFVVLGDLHYSVYPTGSLCRLREEYYENLFSRVLEQKPDAVFAIGDTVDNGLPEEFDGLYACARRVGLNFHIANGNHDLLTLPRNEIARWTGNIRSYYELSYDPITGAAGQRTGEPSNFIVLDTPKEKSPKDHGGYMWPEQREWLGQKIKASEDRPLFVFGHHPIKSETLYSSFKMLNMDNSKEVKETFFTKKSGKGFYFCGHNHANSVSRSRNWIFIQTAAVLRTNDFRVVEFTPEQVSLTTLVIKDRNQQKLAGQLTKALGDFLNLPSRGLPGDRKFTVKLAPYGEPDAAPAYPNSYRERVA